MDETPTFRRLSRRFAALEPEREEPGMGSDARHQALSLAAVDAFALFSQKAPAPFPACKTWGEVVREVAIRWPDKLPYRNVVIGRGLESEPPSDLPTETPFIRNSVAVCSLLAELTSEPPEAPEERLRANPLEMSERQRLIMLVLLNAPAPVNKQDLPTPMEETARRIGLTFRAGDDTEIRKKELPALERCEWIELAGGDGSRRGVRLTDAGRAVANQLQKQIQSSVLRQLDARITPAKPS